MRRRCSTHHKRVRKRIECKRRPREQRHAEHDAKAVRTGAEPAAHERKVAHNRTWCNAGVGSISSDKPWSLRRPVLGPPRPSGGWVLGCCGPLRSIDACVCSWVCGSVPSHGKSCLCWCRLSCTCGWVCVSAAAVRVVPWCRFFTHPSTRAARRPQAVAAACHCAGRAPSDTAPAAPAASEASRK